MKILDYIKSKGFNIDVGLFGIKKPSVFGLESKTGKILINSLYSFYIKKSKEN